MTIEEFRAVETLEITGYVWVAGELKKPGDKVQLSGNDKVQLLASKKAKKAEDKSAKK